MISSLKALYKLMKFNLKGKLDLSVSISQDKEHSKPSMSEISLALCMDYQLCFSPCDLSYFHERKNSCYKLNVKCKGL